MTYQPVRYHHIKQEDLYIDHRNEKSPWEKFKERVLQSADILDARLKTVFDKRLRASYRTNFVRNCLRGVGLNSFDLMKSETFYIAKLLHKDETILGAVVGRLNEGGSALMVVTDLRIIYLNQIPLFTKMDEIGYAIVAGISSNDDRWGASVTLHTAIGDYALRNVNTTAAKKFVDAIERVAIDQHKVGTDQLNAADYRKTMHQQELSLKIEA